MQIEMIGHATIFIKTQDCKIVQPKATANIQPNISNQSNQQTAPMEPAKAAR
jgi:hypothetical protein